MWGVNASCYIRIPFSVDDPAVIKSLFLNIRFDDGFVAYLNGHQIARDNAPDTLAWDENAVFPHEASTKFQTIPIASFSEFLEPGQNLLAIQGLNASLTSLDFLVSVELRWSEESIVQGAYLFPIALDKSVQVKAAAYDGSEWSALCDAVYSVGSVAEKLRVTELMYHPTDPDEEFIEVTNMGDASVNLNMVQFTRGIDFTFGDVNLSPGQSAVVVRDMTAFEARYGHIDQVVGQFSGSLDNGGERIVLSDPLGQPIVDFRYRDDWYPATDGSGLSLVALTPQAC